MVRCRCNYVIDKFPKFIKGELIFEDKEKIIVKSEVNGNEVAISQDSIKELIKIPEQKAAKK